VGGASYDDASELATQQYVGNGFVARKGFDRKPIVNGTDGGCIGAAYVVDYNGNDTIIPIHTQNQSFAIVCRDGGGNFYISDPSLPWHAATKRYVDDAIAAALAQFVNVAEEGA
jgi:hypothetical protein